MSAARSGTPGRAVVFGRQLRRRRFVPSSAIETKSNNASMRLHSIASANMVQIRMTSSAAALSTDATAPAKNHYPILDGLRGVASLMVVVFHLFEAYSGAMPSGRSSITAIWRWTSSSCCRAS
jgi:uncharacterized membrane protein